VLISNLDRTAYPHVTEADKLQDKALWLLRIANDDFSIDGLSAPEISKVLKDKFRPGRRARRGHGRTPRLASLRVRLRLRSPARRSRPDSATVSASAQSFIGWAIC